MAEQLAVTSETVRKDLIALERQGQLRRVHGGAIPLQDLSFEPEVTARVEFAEEKRRIAKAALAHLPRTGTILIDAGSTTAPAGRAHPARPAADRVHQHPADRARAGGQAQRHRVHARRPRPQRHARRGRRLGRPHARRDQRRRRVPRRQRHLPAPRPHHTGPGRSRRQAASCSRCARRRILLADHSKIDQVATHKYGDLADIDLLITDTGIAAADDEALNAAGLTTEKT